MFFVLRSLFYVLCSTFFVLRSLFYVLCSTFFVLRSLFYVPYSPSRRFVLCSLFFVQCSSLPQPPDHRLHRLPPHILPRSPTRLPHRELVIRPFEQMHRRGPHHLRRRPQL